MLPPVQKLVATLIFARPPQGQKCKRASSPTYAKFRFIGEFVIGLRPMQCSALRGTDCHDQFANWSRNDTVFERFRTKIAAYCIEKFVIARVEDPWQSVLRHPKGAIAQRAISSTNWNSSVTAVFLMQNSKCKIQNVLHFEERKPQFFPL